MALGLVVADPSLAPVARVALQELLELLAKGGGLPDAAPPGPAADGSPERREPAGTEAGTPRASHGGAFRRDDFLMLGPLGAGSFATVHEVAERTSRRRFALKEVAAWRLSDAAFSEQIRREATTHASLRHPHVLRCYCSFNDELGSLFMLQEVVEGGDLYRLMRSERTLEEGRAARLFAELCSAVRYLHAAGVMHRDLKPENILLDTAGCAKLADFGWCASMATRQTLECGSPAYFAPEMVDGHGYDEKVDHWALGILLYEMLVGHSPFSLALTEMETKRRVAKMDFEPGAWANVPAAAQPLIQALLRRAADERLSLPTAMLHPWTTTHAGDAACAALAELAAQASPDGPAGPAAAAEA